MKKSDYLPYDYLMSIKEKLKTSDVHYNKKLKQVIVSNIGSDYLTFDNFKFLADLFKTTKVNTGTFIDVGGGCPTCGTDDPELEIEFIVSEVEVSNE